MEHDDPGTSRPVRVPGGRRPSWALTIGLAVLSGSIGLAAGTFLHRVPTIGTGNTATPLTASSSRPAVVSAATTIAYEPHTKPVASKPPPPVPMTGENLNRFAQAFTDSLNEQDHRFAAEDAAKANEAGRNRGEKRIESLQWECRLESAKMVLPEVPGVRNVGRFVIRESQKWVGTPANSFDKTSVYTLTFDVYITDGVWQIYNGTQVTETFIDVPGRGLTDSGPIRRKTGIEWEFDKQLDAARAGIAKQRS